MFYNVLVLFMHIIFLWQTYVYLKYSFAINFTYHKNTTPTTAICKLMLLVILLI